MRLMAKILPALVAALFVFATASAPATAACKKMGFLVNDYGKDGPTKDAQLLLDKHIAAWADEQGIEEYSVGKKTVKCELFIDLILFDEHTCTASATVCWGGSKQPKTQVAKKKSKKSKSKQAKAKKTSAKKVTKTADKKPADKKPIVKTVAKKTETVKPKAATQKVETSAIVRDAPAQAKSPAVPYADNAIVRSSDGAQPRNDTATQITRVTPPSAERSSAVSAERAAADRAAAAAERAAAAAERAAAAAQKAAEAAKQAAAARSSAIVPPVEPSGTR